MNSTANYVIGQTLESRYEIVEPIYTSEQSNLYEAKDLQDDSKVWILLLNQLYTYEEKIIDAWLKEVKSYKRVKSKHWKKPTQVFDNRDKRVFAVFAPETDATALPELVGELEQSETIDVFSKLALLIDEATALKQEDGKAAAFPWLNLMPFTIWLDNKGNGFRWLRIPVIPPTSRSQIKTDQHRRHVEYLSSEEASGEATQRESSFFTLGTMLAEVVSGKKMFEDENELNIVEEVIKGAPETLKKVALSEGMRSLLRQLMTSEPASRLSNPNEFSKKLKETFETESYAESGTHDIPSGTHEANSGTFAGASGSHEGLSISETPSYSSFSAQDWSSADLTSIPASSDQTMRIQSPSAEDILSHGSLLSPSGSNPVPVFKEEKKTEKEESPGWFGTRLPEQATLPPGVKSARRKGSVSHFKQMNPGKLYPLLVDLVKPENELQTPEIEDVAQVRGDGEAQASESSPMVRIVPILPGCIVSPSEMNVNVYAKQVQAEFWVAPQIPADLTKSAKIQLWHAGRLKDEIKIPCKVKTHFLTKLSAFCSFATGIGGYLIKNYQKALPKATAKTNEATDLISTTIKLIMDILASSGVQVSLAFLALTIVSYFYLRPKKGNTIEHFLSPQIQ